MLFVVFVHFLCFLSRFYNVFLYIFGFSLDFLLFCLGLGLEILSLGLLAGSMKLGINEILQKNAKSWKNLRNVAKYAHNFCDKLNLCSFQKLIFAAPGHLLVSNHLNNKSGVGGWGFFMGCNFKKK